MNFFEKNIRETLEVINEYIKRNYKIISTKKVREFQKVKSSNRSKINIIWRSL